MRRASFVFLAVFVGLAGCRRPAPAPSPAGSASATTGGAASASARASSPPVSLRGSNVALTADETTLVVADEDHEVLYLVPASLTDPARTRVVPLPGPPAQVVVLGERVLVTLRTLPTPASRQARDAVRGPLPVPAKVTLLASEPGASSAPAASAAPSASVAAAPSGSSSASSAKGKAPTKREKRIAAVKHGKTRPRNTPPAIFDPALIRQSEGGLLLVFAFDAAAGLREVGRVALPPDAWGLAVTADQKRALVTSPWPAQVSLVELEPLRAVASVATPREPRGIAITPDGKLAYLSHLTGTSLTELTLTADSLVPRELPLPPAPARTPPNAKLEASLGYDLVLGPDTELLFVPRHALGAEGVGSWWGAPTVDVLERASGKPLQPFRGAKLGARLTTEQVRMSADWEASPGQPPSPAFALVQPRAVAYRKTRDTLLVASEGANTLTELDALAADPAMAVVKVHTLGGDYDPFGTFPDRCGAPAGIALGRDDAAAFVYCRTTFDLARVELDSGALRFVHLADDGLPADAAYGRRLFADATSGVISGSLGCAGCHPEGRDDGYVWREGKVSLSDLEVPRFVGRRENVKLHSPFMTPENPRPALYPRQTPMLAGRVRSNGPYGWHAESPDIVQRLVFGTRLHREGWSSYSLETSAGEDMAKVDYLADYLRSGLLPPPTLVRALDAREERGKAIFESEETRCSRCHVPASEFTDRAALPLPPLPVRSGFDVEPNPAFKTPSLWFIAGSAPYFHDGSRATLEELIAKNGDRMGKTSQLNPDDQAALVAYLRSL